MKIKIAVVICSLLLLTGGVLASRDSTICPVHNVQALATGHVKDGGTTCEYSHYVAGGGTHTFWHSCD
jgi:hypothetical protein